MEVAGLTGREIERSWRQAKGRKCRNCVEVKELHFVLFVLVGSSQEFVNGQHCNFYWKTLLCRKLVNIWSLLSWGFFFFCLFCFGWGLNFWDSLYLSCLQLLLRGLLTLYLRRDVDRGQTERDKPLCF